MSWKKKLLDKKIMCLSSHYLQNFSIFTNKKFLFLKKKLRHFSIWDFKKTKILIFWIVTQASACIYTVSIIQGENLFPCLAFSSLLWFSSQRTQAINLSWTNKERRHGMRKSCRKTRTSTAEGQFLCSLRTFPTRPSFKGIINRKKTT